MKPAGALAASRRIAGVFEERLKLTQERWIFGPEDKLIVQTMLGLPFLLAAGFLAQLVAALFRRGEVVQVVLLALGMPFFFLSGFAWPVEAIPAHLNALAQLIPSTAAIDGLVRVTQMGATLPEIAPILWHLWALAAGLGLVVLAVETVSPSRPAAPDRGPTAPSDSPAR